MPIIDLLCHYGLTEGTRALAEPSLADAVTYADSYGVEALCFAGAEATTDIAGGNAALAKALQIDPRFYGWLTLSVHQSEHSQELAAYYFRQERWVGTRLDQETEADAVDAAGGHELLTGLRRYGRPVLLAISTHGAIQAAIAAAREFHNLRFLLSPQNEDVASDMLPMVREVLNISLVPVAARIERDLIGQAVATLGERGERRVLWASDWGRYHPAAAVGLMKDSAIDRSQRDRIMYRNALELLPMAGS